MACTCPDSITLTHGLAYFNSVRQAISDKNFKSLIEPTGCLMMTLGKQFGGSDGPLFGSQEETQVKVDPRFGTLEGCCEMAEEHVAAFGAEQPAEFSPGLILLVIQVARLLFPKWF